MIHGFLNNKIVSIEEYLIDLELHKGKSVSISHNLIDMSIRFDSKEVYTFILDVVDDSLIVQLVLPLKEKFDDNTNVYKNSYIRKLLNSDDFLSRFNKEFIEHIKPTEVHTEDYITADKLWLLSHEEISQPAVFLKTNNNYQPFDLFEHTDMQNYSEMLLKLNKQNCYGWRLRSAYSYAYNEYNSSSVGIVTDYGYVYGNNADDNSYGAICPVCII